MRKVPPVNELRKICQPSGESWWARHIEREISIYITKVLLYTPIRGNQVTLLWVIVGIIAGIMFAFGDYWYSIISALLVQFLFILDCVDGEISRYRGTCSLKGEYLDRLCHNISYPCIFVGITFGVYANYHSIWAFIFGFSATIFFLLMWLVELERINIISKVGKDIKDEEETITTVTKQKGGENIGSCLLKRIGGKIIDPTNIYVVMIVILIGAIFNCLHIVLAIYGILMPCRWLVQVYFNLKYKF